MGRKLDKSFAVAAVCFGLIAAVNGIILGCSGVFFTPACEELGLYRGTYSFHMTLVQAMVAVGGTFMVPVLYRRLPFKAVLTTAVVVCTAGTWLMGRADSVAVIYLIAVVRGAAAAAFATVPVNMLLNAWFTKGFGTAASLVFCGTGLAGSAGALLLSSVTERFGWRMGYAAQALIILACCLPAILVPYSLRPQDEGRLPYGGEDPSAPEEETGKKAGFLHRMDGPVWMLVFMTVIFGFITSFSQHFTGYAESIGLAAAGAVLLSVTMAGNIFFKLGMGAAAERIGAVGVVCACLASCLAGMVMMPLAASRWTLWTSGVLYSACNAIGAVGLSLLVRRWYGQHGFDSVFPYLSLAGNAGAAASLSVIGYIFDFTGSYLPVTVICSVFTVLTGVIVLTVERLWKRGKVN